MDLIIFFSSIWNVSLMHAGFRQLNFIMISIVPPQNCGRQSRGKQEQSLVQYLKETDHEDKGKKKNHFTHLMKLWHKKEPEAI